MIISRKQMTNPDLRFDFRIVCINCDALGIVFDCPEDAPTSTQIRRRRLSYSDRQDVFEV